MYNLVSQGSACNGVGAMKKFIFALASIAAVIGLIVFYQRRAPAPNVVMVIIDTLRADKLGAYGHPSPASLALDTLAKRGIVFEKAISQASWTRSSMASLLTGKYPRRIPLLKEKWDKLPLNEHALAEVLQEAGYTTVGLTANPQLNKDFHFEQGFTEYVESSVTFGWMKSSPGKQKAHGRVQVKTAPEILERASEIVDVLYDGSAPLYLQVLLMDVHAHHRIEEDEIDDDLRQYPDRQYLQAVRNATAPLAEFIESMRVKLGQNTVFIITSDHGEGFLDHPSVGGSNRHGNLLYQSHIHVPLIFLGEESLLGRYGVRSQLVELIHVFPTITSLAGATNPAKIDGSSLLPLMKDPHSAFPSSYAFSETMWRKRVRKQAVTDGEWMYIENRDEWKGTAPQELQKFNGAQDGAKTNELALYGDKIRTLQTHLEKIQGSFR